MLLGILFPTANTTADTKPVYVPDRLDHWIDQLAFFESGNRSGIKVLDVNGKYSYGCLQFQMDTFKSYYRLVAPELSVEPPDYEKLIYDCSEQKMLAKAILTANSGRWTLWYNTVKSKLGLPPL